MFCSPGAVCALPPPHGLQPVHRVRLPRFHEHSGVWLLRHPHHPLQQLLLPELPQQEEEEMSRLGTVVRIVSTRGGGGTIYAQSECSHVVN